MRRCFSVASSQMTRELELPVGIAVVGNVFAVEVGYWISGDDRKV